MKRKFTLEEVQADFEAHDCRLLSVEYLNSKQKLNYVCLCGHEARIEYRLFRSGKRCNYCRIDRMLATTRANNNGKLHFETSEFLSSRRTKYIEKFGVESPLQNPEIQAKRIQTNLQRYGVPHAAQAEENKKRRKSATLAKYGAEHIMQVPEFWLKCRETFRIKHGVTSLAAFSQSCSKISQRLFYSLYSALPPEDQTHTHCGFLNHEFTITAGNTHYQYDFVLTSRKKCIEFHGDKFHPKTDYSDDFKGWCVFHPNLTAGDARDREKVKFQALTDRGYEIFILWESDFKRDPDAAIQKCVDFLSKEIDGS